jgi:Zn-dependent M28 family amino/carboxypeptidase
LLYATKEFDRPGSYHFTKNLSLRERFQIRLYLNFDMIASPSYTVGIYDADGTGYESNAQVKTFFPEYSVLPGGHVYIRLLRT